MHESKPPSEQLIEELCAKWGEGGGLTPIQVFQHYLKAHTQSRGDVLTIASSNRPDKTTAECRLVATVWDWKIGFDMAELTYNNALELMAHRQIAK